MKIAITSMGNSPESIMDKRFGRCAYFVIYDTHTQGLEFLPNKFRQELDNAGINVARLLSSKGVLKIVTGELGAKVKPFLDSNKIQLIIYPNHEKTIQDIIKLLNQK